MLTRTPPAAALHGSQSEAQRLRDPRLDFFRGLALFIILIAHVPFDEWALFIPARFGFSDATEIFVFLSGMASALAFGRLFDRHGLLMVSARIGLRIWQIYWAHIGLFMATAALMVVSGMRPDGNTYVTALNLEPFFQDPANLLPRLMVLSYVPNFFDILPMYMVLLALIPVMLSAERLHAALPFLLMGGLWLATQFGATHLPAEPWSSRPWFFNPFGWQLLFFAGFYLKRRPIAALPAGRIPVLLSLAVLLLAVPFSWHPLLERYPVLQASADALVPLTDKTAFGIFRFVHFLALAYLANRLVGNRGERLRGVLADRVQKVGKQSLAVFVFSMFLAQTMGIALDLTDRGLMVTLAVNLAGFVALVLSADIAAWFKASPWKSG